MGPHSKCGHGIDDRGAMLLMPSTLSAYPQVISRSFAPFPVPRSAISAGQPDFHGGFDSRQLH